MDETLTIDIYKTIFTLQGLVKSLRNDESLEKTRKSVERVKDLCTPTKSIVGKCLTGNLFDSPDLSTSDSLNDIREDLGKNPIGVLNNIEHLKGESLEPKYCLNAIDDMVNRVDDVMKQELHKKYDSKRLLTRLSLVNLELKDIQEQSTGLMHLVMTHIRRLTTEYLDKAAVQEDLVKDISVSQLIGEESETEYDDEMASVLATIYNDLETRMKAIKERERYLAAENSVLKETLAGLDYSVKKEELAPDFSRTKEWLDSCEDPKQQPMKSCRKAEPDDPEWSPLGPRLVDDDDKSTIIDGEYSDKNNE